MSRPRTRSLQLEPLEDRLAPAVYTVTADLHVHGPAPTQAPPAERVVFVESSVPQARMLLAGLAPGIDGVLLDAQGNGLREMAAFLTQRSELTAIDVVAHGQSGVVNLGALNLDEATLAADRPQLGVLAAALGGQGSLDLWSCDVAAGSSGRAFVNDLAAASGGHVAAARHLVGAVSLGGRLAARCSRWGGHGNQPLHCSDAARVCRPFAVDAHRQSEHAARFWCDGDTVAQRRGPPCWRFPKRQRRQHVHHP